MRFNICVIDPKGYPFTHFLFDVVRTIAFGLEDLGHEASIGRNRIDPRAVNVLVGVHILDSARWVEELVDSAARYVVFQTEMIHGRTVNHVPLGDRFETVLLPLLRSAKAVWDSSTDNIAALANLGVPAEHLLVGSSPRLAEIRHKTERDIDFFWFGSITPHRRAVLNELVRLGYSVETCFDDMAMFRNDLAARSEIILSLRQSDEMPHVPHGRIAYMANNRCLVAGEGGVGQEPVEDLFAWTERRKVADVVEFLRTTRARSDRRELADLFHERHAKRPMSGYLAPLVERIAP